ncbi:MAG: hypothetical protein LC792_03630 [Actinobacteria bacterium]|nr:hypothetical protein [Actinomycetota bacterium]
MSEQRTRQSTLPAGTGGRASSAASRTTSVAGRQGREVAETTRAQSREVAGSAVDRGRQVVEASKGDARQVVGTARQQAVQVRQELAVQSRRLVDQTRSQVHEQAETQAERLASGLRQLGQQTEARAQDRPEEAGSFGDFVGQAGDRLQEWADDLEARGLEGVVEDVSELARRRPGVFLAGAVVVGFGVGRLLRNGAASSDGELEETGPRTRPGTRPAAAAGRRELNRAGVG